MTEWANVKALEMAEGNVKFVELNDELLWKRRDLYGYVSLGDSIAAGHTINDDWESDYGADSQYGKNDNVSTALVPGCYTDLIRSDLITTYGEKNVFIRSFARSGDRVDDLMEKLTHDTVQRAIKKADLVTVCIGANDVLEPAMSALGEYINMGDSRLEFLATEVEANLAVLADDSNANSYTALFNRLTELNPKAKVVFMTIYNPYKYLWIEEGNNGFFGPLLDTIPSMTILGFDIDNIIKDNLLSMDIVELLFDRVNGLNAWAEKFVSLLNDVLRRKITAYQATNPNISLTESKVLWESFPDRPVSAVKHYNDLVSVEYTRGYDTAKMDWGRLWEGSNAATFWVNLASKYVSTSGLNLSGFTNDLMGQIIEKVVTPDVDPHPEEYGHYVLKRSFVDTLGWTALDRHTITYMANGGTGTMAAQTVPGVDGIPAFVNLNAVAFAPGTEGYYFAGWNTAADGSGTSYTNGQLVGVTGDMTLYAQWSNIYYVIYRHTNHTIIYTDDETGHKECYALYINGELKPKFGTFASGSSTTYALPYGTTIKVAVSNYNPSELLYDDINCDVYWNGTSVAKGYRGTEYTFTLTGNVDIDFRWKIAGSLATFDAQSWEDCYITTM